MLPRVESITEAKIFKSVDFPDPFGPRIEAMFPGASLKFNDSNILFHAGTKSKNGKVYSNGGRVLNISSMGNNFKKIRENILKIIKKISWKSGFFRKDIGWKVIKK